MSVFEGIDRSIGPFTVLRVSEITPELLSAAIAGMRRKDLSAPDPLPEPYRARYTSTRWPYLSLILGKSR